MAIQRPAAAIRITVWGSFTLQMYQRESWTASRNCHPGPTPAIHARKVPLLPLGSLPQLARARMQLPIARRAASLSPSVTLAIDSAAKRLKADIDVVGFGAGEPGFRHAAAHQDAAAKAHSRTDSPSTPSSGIPELRQAIADKFQRKTDSAISRPRLSSATVASTPLLQRDPGHLSGGTRVLIPAPYWLSYPEMVKLAGATPVILPTTDQTGSR